MTKTELTEKFINGEVNVDELISIVIDQADKIKQLEDGKRGIQRFVNEEFYSE